MADSQINRFGKVFDIHRESLISDGLVVGNQHIQWRVFNFPKNITNGRFKICLKIEYWGVAPMVDDHIDSWGKTMCAPKG
jgi:hypothetical protein